MHEVKVTKLELKKEMYRLQTVHVELKLTFNACERAPV